MSTVAHPLRLRLWARLLAVPVTAALLLLGLWIFAGLVAPGYDSSIGFGIGWFVVAYLGVRLLLRRRPELKLPVQSTFATTAIVVGIVFAWTTFRDETVVEQVATGVAASEVGTSQAAPAGNVELSAGEIVGLAHQSSGRAAIVELAGAARALTLTDLDTDNGPDLRVYLVAGPVESDGDVDDFVDLGALKGNKGTQQYEIPEGVDVSRYSTFVIWCRAFTVSFAKAELMPA